ncbi:hypothetical protein OG558_12715 [Kribbella sp. NBC_01510]|uniref:hypothetical protein n=1 Tax=Kribbella sp. NBC_01510 TaxID=2903581 RepID=UPI003863FFCB
MPARRDLGNPRRLQLSRPIGALVALTPETADKLRDLLPPGQNLADGAEELIHGIHSLKEHTNTEGNTSDG